MFVMPSAGEVVCASVSVDRLVIWQVPVCALAPDTSSAAALDVSASKSEGALGQQSCRLLHSGPAIGGVTTSLC